VTSPRITNAVLQERQDQQHTQVMLMLARVEDKVTTLCQRMQEAEITSAKDQARIMAMEVQQEVMRGDLSSVKARTLRIIVVVAVLSGASSVAAERLLGLLLP